METIKEFKKQSRNPELVEAVFNQMGLEFSEVLERPFDFRDASVGVSGFIYYCDTISFAKSNLWLITKALNEFETEVGQLNKPTDDETQYLNWLSWFALETVVDELITLTQ